jgi:hypothetical protein
MRGALLVLVLCGEVANASPEQVATRLADAVRTGNVARVTALLARDVKRDGLQLSSAACRRRVMSRRVLAACLVKEGVATTQRPATLTFASGIEVELAIEGDRITAIVSAGQRVPATMTAREAVDLYLRVGKKLRALDRTAGQSLFARYRRLQPQRMIGTPEERVQGIEELIALEREADRI